MDSKDNGPFAFPGKHMGEKWDGLLRAHMPAVREHSGMTLRDWFAGQALAGVLANERIIASAPEVVAQVYEIADAMLEARK